jgi:hypothetical protein
MELNFDDVAVFFGTFTKSNNDKTNKLRESIIEHILNKKIPKPWYSSPEWFKVALRLQEFIKPFEKEHGTLQKVIHKGGRNYNYDFVFEFEKADLKIEFKNGVRCIAHYPEILSVSSDTFVKGTFYPERFYDFYLSCLSHEELPPKEFYLKNIHKMNVNHPFFIKLKEIDDFKVTVDESIDDYLQNFLEFDYAAFKEKLRTLLDKKYMLWKNEQFYLDTLSEDDIDIVPEHTLKKGKNGFNTIVIKTKNEKTSYQLLLRWKNHAGVLYPAWQIKYKSEK